MSAILEVLRSMRRSERGRLSCPQCASPVRRSKAPLEGWMLPVKYVCTKCNYSGFLVMENGPVEEQAPEK